MIPGLKIRVQKIWNNLNEGQSQEDDSIKYLDEGQSPEDDT